VPGPALTSAALYSCSPGSEWNHPPAMRARGFSPTLLVGLVGAGYAVAKPQTMRAAGRTLGVMRFVITDAGRRALG
jgi:hypothetical protein